MRRAGRKDARRVVHDRDKALKFGTGVPKGPELAQAPEAHMRERALKALEISRGGEALAVGGIGAVAQERDGVEPVELDRVKGPAGSGGRERKCSDRAKNAAIRMRMRLTAFSRNFPAQTVFFV